MAGQVFVVSKTVTPRLQYVVNYIFNERLGISAGMVANTAEAPAGSVVLFYGDDKGGFSVPEAGLLNQTGIGSANPEVSFSGNMPVIFSAEEKNYTITFDIFSAVFWMLGRCEEYGAAPKDAHGRFPAAESLAAKSGFLEQPIVDLWIDHFKKKFTKYFPQIRLKEEIFSVQYTYDIDQAYCYAGKSFFRSAGGMAKQVAKGRFAQALKRLAVKSSMANDPYDVFPFIEAAHRGQQQPIIFWQVGPHGQYDKNLPALHPMMLNILAKTKKFTKPALHPSYAAAANAEEIARQKLLLQGAAEANISQSRQHYIRLLLPQTYEALIEAGITEDYSMGYPDAAGFRAGTAHPFFWYNLQREEATDLRIHPFCIMDVTLRHYLQLTPAEAKEKVHKIIGAVRQANGTFIPVWHNESLSEYGIWQGWRSVFEDMVQYLGSANEH